MYNNKPEDYVKKDLSCYNQDNLYPKSLTVVEGIYGGTMN